MKKFYQLLMLVCIGLTSCNNEYVEDSVNQVFDYSEKDENHGEECKPDKYPEELCPFIVGFAIFDENGINIHEDDEDIIRKIKIEYDKKVYQYDPNNKYMRGPIMGVCDPTVFVGEVGNSNSVFYFGPLNWFQKANFTIMYGDYNWNITTSCELVIDQYMLDIDTYIDGELKERVLIDTFSYESGYGVSQGELYAYPLYL